MTQYLRIPFTLLLAGAVALLLLQLPQGKLAEARNLNAPVLVEGGFNLELKGGLILDPEYGPTPPLNYSLATPAQSPADSRPAYAAVGSTLSLPPSRAPPVQL